MRVHVYNLVIQNYNRLHEEAFESLSSQTETSRIQSSSAKLAAHHSGLTTHPFQYQYKAVRFNPLSFVRFANTCTSDYQKLFLAVTISRIFSITSQP